MLNLALISPALAFGIAELYSLEPELAVGLVLLGRLARGHDGEHAHPPGARRHGALDHDDRDLVGGRGDHRAALPRALDERISAPPGSTRTWGCSGVVARVLLITVVPLAFGM